MSSPDVIRVEEVSKRFTIRRDKSLKERLVAHSASQRHREDFWALHDINCNIQTGTTVGLIGHNGSGKSTLLKVIGGILAPTTGRVQRRGRVAALLELGAGFHPDLTGRENVFLNASILGLTQQETERHFDEIVEFSGVAEFIDTQVKFYSSGMYVRLAFAVAVHVDPDILLVDEVLAVGDEPFQRKCMDKIAQFQREGRTIVLVSHSADQVGRICDRTMLLNGGELVFDGDPVEGLRELRRGFEEDRLRAEEAARDRQVPQGLPELPNGDADDADEAETRYISAHARLNGVEVTGSQMHNGIISEDADIVVTLDCEFTAKIGSWDAGIGIETASGQPVYSVSTSDLGVELPPNTGRTEVRFTLPRNKFGRGQYVVNAAMARYKGELIAGLNPAATFEIENSGRGNGVIAIQPEVEVSAPMADARRADARNTDVAETR